MESGCLLFIASVGQSQIVILFLELVAQEERVVNETKLVDKHDKFGRLIP